MMLVKAIIRPERSLAVLEDLMAAGFPAVTQLDVCGRGRQKGIELGGVRYDELPKRMLLIVCRAEDAEDVVSIVMRAARTGEGHIGDGRVFCSKVERAWTISDGREGL